VEGVVAAVPGTSRLFCRLREMGVVPGVRIRVLRTGTSLVVQVGEGRLCLRRKDAAPILVAPEPAAPR
jgi:Fe2+ transport system protein FeoA